MKIPVQVDAMMIAVVLTSGAIAGTAAMAAFVFGWGLLASILIYCLGGSLTLLLLAGLALRRAHLNEDSNKSD